MAILFGFLETLLTIHFQRVNYVLYAAICLFV